MVNSSKKIVILIGPPGSGKDTQADLLAEDFGFYHLKTSRIIQAKFAEQPDDPVMKAEFEKFKSGQLNSPELVISWIMDRVNIEIAQGRSIVFSGSPRTTEEAEKEIPVFEELCGKENIFVFHIDINLDESVRRNTMRKVCKANGHPIPHLAEFANVTVCPKDGSEIETRILDKPDTIKVRYQVYLDQTAPALDVFQKSGYTVIRVNGEQGIRNVHTDILKNIDAHAHTDTLAQFGE